MPSLPCRSQSGAGRGLVEGCFCPDGHTLFNTHTNVCVRECGEHGPSGPDPRAAAEPEAEGLGWEDPSGGPSLPGAHSPSPVPILRVQCGHNIEFSGGFCPQQEEEPWLGVGRPGLQGHVSGPVISAHWVWDPGTPTEPPFFFPSSLCGTRWVSQIRECSAPQLPAPWLEQREGGPHLKAACSARAAPVGAGVGHPGVRHIPVPWAALGWQLEWEAEG